MKAKYQNQEQVQGNNLVASSVGTNFDRRHKQFKRYFSIQHPYLPVPTQKTHPNLKVDPFLNHLNIVFMQAVHLPECISCDEQPISFHGTSSLKQRIKLKKQVMDFKLIHYAAMGTLTVFIFVISHLLRSISMKGMLRFMQEWVFYLIN